MRLPSFYHLAALAVVVAMPQLALSQQTYSWTYQADFTLSVSDARLNLLATQRGAFPDATNIDGLPDGVIWARCLPVDGPSRIAIQFESAAVASQHGDFVEFNVSGTGGGAFTHRANVVEAGTSPVDGVEIIVFAGGPEMAMLANSERLIFDVPSVGGTRNNVYDIAANQSYVSAFDEDCAALAPGGALNPTDPGAITQGGGPLVPDLSASISGHVWSRYTEVSDNVFETVLQVFYGVPETDIGGIYGSCFIGAQGPLVAMHFAADIDGFSDGDVVTLRITSGDGRVVNVEGSVLGEFFEEGSPGIEVVLDVSDPAWLVIAGDPTIRFERVGGQGSLTINGNGPSTLGPFLTDCDQIGELQPQSGVSPSAPIDAQEGYLSCDSYRRVASQTRNRGEAVEITFINETGFTRGVIWIDFDGNPIDYGTLAPGEQRLVQTHSDHIWMMTDGPGNCREMLLPADGQTEYRLRAR